MEEANDLLGVGYIIVCSSRNGRLYYCFLVFHFSHPTVGSNWLLLLFNPLPLFYLPFMIYRELKHKKDLYHTCNLVYLTLFMVLFPFLPQDFNLTVLPLALGLLEMLQAMY